MFERFSDRARRAVVAAQDEARMLGHNHIGSEHLLLGLLDVEGRERGERGEQADVLAEAGVTVEAARAQVEQLAGPRSKSPAGHIPFTPRAKKVLELSLREALEQGKGYIGTEHILLAVMREQDGLGAQILQRLAGPLPALRERVLATARAATPEAAEEEEDGGPGSAPWNWQLARPYSREADIRPQSVVGFRHTLTLIDERLAAIERHLGIPAGEEVPGGFRALLASVDRHLTNIERRLGVPAGAHDAPGEPDEPPAEPDEPSAAAD